MQNTKEYIQFVNVNKSSIPVFYHPEWLNAVSDNSWLGLVYKNKGGDIEAIMPIPYIKKFGKLLIKMPKQTQFLGIWLKNNYDRNFKNYDTQQKVIDYFITQIPKNSFYQIRFDPKLKNIQPFLWHGYKQTTQYSYVLNNIKNHETLYMSFKGSVRTDLKKAEKIVEIIISDDIESFYSVNKLSFQRQNMDIKYSFELVNKIDTYLKKNNQRRILFAKDKNGNIHAVLYLFWDYEKAYYLWGGADPEYRNSNAQTLLLWEAIKIASKHVDSFDFEGSMIQGVAKAFRKFNAEAVPYHRIYKTKNIFLKIYKAIKG